MGADNKKDSPIDNIGKNIGKQPESGTLDWYKNLWATCELSPLRSDKDNLAYSVFRLNQNKLQYQQVEAETGVTWKLIGALHGLEAGFDLTKNLANGQPINQKTTITPVGIGPFSSWQESAVQTLKAMGFDKIKDWPIEVVLQKAEIFNGLGYLKFHPEVLSPYLWSCTNHYTTGKYVADGLFDPNVKSLQVGVAAIFKALPNSDPMIVS